MNLSNVINNQLSRIGVEVSLRESKGLYQGFFNGKLKRLSEDCFLLVKYSDQDESSCRFQITVGKYLTGPVGYLTQSNMKEFNTEYKSLKFPVLFVNDNKIIHVSSGAKFRFNSTEELVRQVSSLLKEYIDVLEAGKVEDVFFGYDTEVELQRFAH